MTPPFFKIVPSAGNDEDAFPHDRFVEVFSCP
jgi:hypothetical protein